MMLIREPAEMRQYLQEKLAAGIATGFVPTMGALHPGHLKLVSRARKENELVLCSIFVNPTQFNNRQDYNHYPVTLEKDIYLLLSAGCDVLFLPTVEGMYPSGLAPIKHYPLGYLEEVLEGKYRPGHFQGVCQVVNRLLEIIRPKQLYLGQKDLQQCLVITKLIQLESFETTVVICTTQRETDGLAMSSRNMRLSAEERLKAPLLYQALLKVTRALSHGRAQSAIEAAIVFLQEQDFKVDYISLARMDTLEPVFDWDGSTPVAILAAAFLNNTRLIDNIIIREEDFSGEALPRTVSYPE